MKPSEVLFDLIRSLSKGEKRNFKLLAQLGSGSKAYIRLFDLVDRQAVYDESRLIRQYQKIQPKGQFSVAKNYLYKSIIKSLVYFDKSDRSEQSSLIQEIRALMSKRLYKHAYKQLKKAKEGANQRESFDELMVLLELEELVLHRLEKIQDYEQSIHRIEREQKIMMQKMVNLQQYRALWHEITMLVRKRVVARNSDSEKKIEQILGNPLMENEQQAMTVQAKIRYNAILHRVWFYRANHHKCLEFTQRMVELYENSPEIRKNNLLDFIYVRGVLAVHYFKVEEFDLSFKMMEELKAVEVKSPEAKVLKFERYYQAMLTILLERGVDEEAFQFMEEMQAALIGIEGSIEENFKLIIYFCFAQFYLQVQDYKSALQWINRFLNMPKTNLRADLQCNARIINLLVHYELGNYELVDYSLKSTYRFIFKRREMNQFEKISLRYIKKLIHAPESESADILFEFKFKLEKLFEEDSYAERASMGIDMLSWLESKIRKCSMATIKKEKALPEMVSAFRV